MPWILLLVGAGLLFWRKDDIMAGAREVTLAVKRELFPFIIPDAAKPYADIILRVADDTGIDPMLIVALGWRESLWGTSKYLDQRGPGGRGDSGHGHGLMQIDDRSWGAWLANNDWTDPETNIRKGVAILRQNMGALASTTNLSSAIPGDGSVTLSSKAAAVRGVPAGVYTDPRPLSGDALLAAAVASYNTGVGNVVYSLASGVHVDTTTAAGAGSSTGNYSQDVLAHASEWAARYVEQSSQAGGDTSGSSDVV